MSNTNHFSAADVGITMKRSSFYRPSIHKTAFSAGKLIPLYCDEILPGDTISLDLDAVIRASTPLHPVMDNSYLDVFCFFVPNRLTWEHWKEFMGESPSDPYINPTEYSVPNLTVAADEENFWGQLGLRGASQSVGFLKSLNALYPRGYVQIWNDWFRDQNLQQGAHLYIDDTDRQDLTYSNVGASYVDHAEFGTVLCPVSKYHDYFTSALPQAQKHSPILLPLSGSAPVVNTLSTYGSTPVNPFQPWLWREMPGGGFSSFRSGDTLSGDGSGMSYFGSSSSTLGRVVMDLSADLSGATAASVNQLRLAFQMQKFYEKQNIGGSRYTETLRSMFGVYSGDARLQRSEYLGGKQFPINQYQVAQTSALQVSTGQPLGDTGAFSLTNGSGKLCRKSFVEHGILYVVGCVRTDQTYSQGIPRQYSRRHLFDYYFPTFAHIGEQPILSKEIFSDNSSDDESVFGYQEAWADYRYKPSTCGGKMMPQVSQSLASWHYGVLFGNRPTLSDQFIRQGVEELDRSLYVQSSKAPQFIFDGQFRNRSVRRMPVYSVPGLIDHF